MSQRDSRMFAASDRDRFTDWLRERSEPNWTAATTHRFTRELGDATLDEDVFVTYLVQDYAFVDSLVSLVGYAVGQAPSMRQKARLADFLGGLTDDEDDYFARSFDALGIDAETHEHPSLAEPTAALRDLLGAASCRGGYAETLAVLLPVEWTYRTWAETVPTPDDPFYYREWVTLHDNPEFDALVSWLRDELDTLGSTLAPRRQRRVASLFDRAVSLEVAFFDAAYE